MYLENLPSIHQTGKNPLTTSEKYAFIPTTRVLSVLADFGWQPVQASEARVLRGENRGYQRHMIRLRNGHLPGDLADVGDVQAEIVVVNSHGGGSAFHLHMGLFVKVCTNGLIVDRSEDFRIAHRGYTDSKVEAALSSIAQRFPGVMARRDELKGIELTRPEQIEFARRAIELRFDDGSSVEPSNVLEVRHAPQAVPNLWNTFNVVQEAIIRGGVWQRSRSGKQTRTRPINAIAETVRLNRGLWRLAEETAGRLGA
jgi:hypothetical protein